MHPAAPAVSPTDPAGQSSQLVLPATELVPALQSTHEVLPGLLLNVPGTQLEQVAAPSAEYVPGVQASQSPDLAAWASGDADPAAHSMHEVCPAASW